MLMNKLSINNTINIKSIYFRLDILCFIAHLIYAIGYMIIDVKPLLFGNLISAGVYLYIRYLIKNDKLVLTTNISLIEITISVSFSIFILGWEAGFQYFLIAFVPLGFYCNFKYNLSRIVAQLSLVFVLILTYIIAKIKEPEYVLNEFLISGMHILNIIICVIVLAYLSYSYAKVVSANANNLNQKYKDLKVIANTDPLTGLLNRRIMLKNLETAMDEFLNFGKDFSLVMIDIDNFKSLNDTHGHECGDVVLAKLAEALLSSTRESDFVCRWGGEEIMILLPQTNLLAGEATAEKIRKQIEDLKISVKNGIISTTITLGVSGPDKATSIHSIINCADQCLYRGKYQGKNQVVAEKC